MLALPIVLIAAGLLSPVVNVTLRATGEKEPKPHSVSQGVPGAGRKTAPDSLNVRLVGSWPSGPSYAVAIDEDRGIAFVGARDDSVFLLDVSDPSRPVRLSAVPSARQYNKGLFYRVPYLYLAEFPALRVVLVDDPRAPIVVGEAPRGGIPQGVTVEDTIAYVSQDLGGGVGYVQLVSVSDPANLRELGEYRQDFGTPWQIVIRDSLAYVANEGAGTLILSVAVPSNPVEVGSCCLPGGQSMGIALSDSLAYIANYGEVKILSVSDPSDPVELGSYVTPGRPVNLVMQDHLIYLAAQEGGLRVLSAADPMHLEEVGYYQTSGSVWAVCYSEPYVYVTTEDEGLMIFEYLDATSVEDGGGNPWKIPRSFSLSQNYPNPFNPSTTIRYSISGDESMHVRLRIFDIRGRLVRGLVDEVSLPGAHFAHWDGRDDHGNEAGSGVFFYTLVAGRSSSTRRMVILR